MDYFSGILHAYTDTSIEKICILSRQKSFIVLEQKLNYS